MTVSKKKSNVSEKEAVTTFKRQVAGLNRAKSFVDWKKLPGFIDKLYFMLENLKAGVKDPVIGMELIADFYDTDVSVFNRTNDRSGYLPAIYLNYAPELFAEYASRCEDKEKIVALILRILSADFQDVRFSFVDCVVDCLPEPEIRSLINAFLEKIDSTALLESERNLDDDDDDDDDPHAYKRRHYYSLIQSLARQIKDAKLYEETVVASAKGDVSDYHYYRFAKVYLECDDVETAKAWLEKMSEENNLYPNDNQEQLWLEIYRRQGQTEQLIALLRQRFKTDRSVEKLQALLDVIGEDQRDTEIAEAVAEILGSNGIQYTDVDFLIAIGRLDEAEAYLYARGELLDGHYYKRLLAYVRAMEPAGKHMVVSLLYRSLLTDILERKYTKAYPHGVRYLRKLDALSPRISEWGRFEHHDAFKQRMKDEHGKKWSFWQQY